MKSFTNRIEKLAKNYNITMKILGCISDFDGCGYFRMQMPFKYLNMTTDCHAKIVYKFREEDIKWADLVVMQKPHLEQTVPFLEYCNQMKKAVVVEMDDLLTDVPDSNPAHQYFKDRKGKILDFIKGADACTVTTDFLKKVNNSFNSNIHVLPNSLDIEEFKKYKLGSNEDVIRGLVFANPSGLRSRNKLHQVLPQKDVLNKLRNKTKIMWWGSPTHCRDTVIVEKTLAKIAKEYPDVLIVVMGMISSTWLKEFDGMHDQLVLITPVQTSVFHKTLSYLTGLGETITIAPIEDNLFNRSKSNLKVIEGMGLKCPVIASNVENYSKTIIHGINGLLANNTLDEEGIATEWYACLKQLLDNKVLANFMAENGYNTVTRDYNISSTVNMWHSAYKNVLEKYK